MNRVARFVWAFIGTAAMQKGPLWWAGHHVNHHKYADRDGDPHSPMVSGFYYAHIGWFLNDTRHDQLPASNPVIRDFSKDFEIAWLERFFFRAAAAAGDRDVPRRRLPVARVGLLPADDDAGARDVRDQHRQPHVRIAPLRDARRVAQQRVHRVLRRRRGVAQQPSPLSARGAQRLLLVGVRSDLVHDPRHGGRRPGVGHSVGARAHLRGSARRESRPRVEGRASVVDAVPLTLELAQDAEPL